MKFHDYDDLHYLRLEGLKTWVTTWINHNGHFVAIVYSTNSYPEG